MYEQHETQNQRGAHNDHTKRRHFLQSNEKHFELNGERTNKLKMKVIKLKMSHGLVLTRQSLTRCDKRGALFNSILCIQLVQTSFTKMNVQNFKQN